MDFAFEFLKGKSEEKETDYPYTAKVREFQ